MSTSPKNDENWPKRFSLFDRAALTFKSFLISDFGNRFYQEKFLDDITARRVEVNARLGKASASCFVITTILAFFDQISGTISLSGLTIRVSEDLIPIIAFITAANFLAVSMAFLDELIIQRYISMLGQHIGIHSFPAMLVDKMAVNLWADAVIPKYFGERSRWGHKAAMLAFSMIALFVTLTLLAYPVFFVAKSIINVWTDNEARLASYVLSVGSGLLLLWATSFILCFSIKFQFDKAHFNEHDLEPTEEFKAEMEAQMAIEHQANASNRGLD